MRSFPSSKAVATFASLAAIAAVSACSDTTTPSSLLGPANDPAFIIGPTANPAGATIISFASNATTQYCSSATQIHVYTVPASLAPIAGCGTAFDLQTNLLTSYNPGWGAPLTGSSWIGPNATSNEYKTAPGSYVFQTTFTLPAGATSPVLNDTLRSDNAVAVYLNGFKVEQQTIADCPSASKLAGTCNWQTSFVISDNNAAHFIIGGVNTITVLLVDTPNGGTAANSYACTEPFQPFGELGFGTPFNVPTSPLHVLAGWTQTMTATTGCENPVGVDFRGTVAYVPAPPPQVCDFITFGRLVTTVGNTKIVISGNAGGNAPGGGILGEIQISVGGTEYHVSTIESYGPTTSGVMFPDAYARVITGHSGSSLVELRLHDNPNPGQGEPGTAEGDRVYLKIGSTVVVPNQTLDQGNIQLHLTCRGPGDVD